MEVNKLTDQAYKHVKLADFSGVSVHFYQPFSHSNGILYTKGLAHENQHELAGKTEQVYPFVEVYFYLPSYWKFDRESENWPLAVLKRLIAGRVQQKVWYGPGDTLTAHPKKNTDSNLHADPPAINTNFKQNHFILTEPMAAEPLLNSLESEPVNFLAIVPIFQAEFEFKTSRSALELIMKFEKKKVTELVDQHRPIAAKKRFFGLF